MKVCSAINVFYGNIEYAYLWPQTYQKFGKSQNTWICDKCKNTDPSKKGKIKKTYTLENIMDKLEDMDRKYNQLFVKYNEQLEINEQLKIELSTINQLNAREQREINKNTVIHKVPNKTNQNLNEIIKNIGNDLEVDLTNDHFIAIRIGKRNETMCPIRVIFKEEMKKKFIKSKNNFLLNTQKLGYTESKNFFINHD